MNLVKNVAKKLQRRISKSFKAYLTKITDKKITIKKCCVMKSAKKNSLKTNITLTSPSSMWSKSKTNKKLTSAFSKTRCS